MKLLTALLLFSTYSLAADLDFSGFIDIQLQISPDERHETFKLEDSSLYASYKRDNFLVYADLPFSGQSDDNLDNSASEKIDIGADKAQLFLQLDHDKDTTIKIGQFDCILGFEEGDTLLMDFTEATEYSGAPFENTQLGIKVDRAFGDLLLELTAANKGARGNAQGDGLEYGARLNYENKSFHTYIGTLNHNDKGEESLDESSNIIEFNIGTKFSKTTFDYVFSQEDVKTNTDVGKGNYIKIGHELNDKLSLFARAETASNLNSAYDMKGQAFGLKYNYRGFADIKFSYFHEELEVNENDEIEHKHKYTLSFLGKF